MLLRECPNIRSCERSPFRPWGLLLTWSQDCASSQEFLRGGFPIKGARHSTSTASNKSLLVNSPSLVFDFSVLSCRFFSVLSSELDAKNAFNSSYSSSRLFRRWSSHTFLTLHPSHSPGYFSRYSLVHMDCGTQLSDKNATRTLTLHGRSGFGVGRWQYIESHNSNR